jgi:hypothetical protein
LKRSRAAHNQGGKLPVLAKSDRPMRANLGAATSPTLYEYLRKLNIMKSVFSLNEERF